MNLGGERKGRNEFPTAKRRSAPLWKPASYSDLTHAKKGDTRPLLLGKEKKMSFKKGKKEEASNSPPSSGNNPLFVGKKGNSTAYPALKARRLSFSLKEGREGGGQCVRRSGE